MRKMFSKEQLEKMIQGMASEIAEKIAKDLISDDKEIISKIVVDSENHTTTFPKGVVPMMYYSENEAYLFFDYIHGKVLYDDGGIFESFVIDEGKVIINEVIPDIDETTDTLVYCYMNNNDDLALSLNFYNLFRDIPTTQLYKHTITHVAEDNVVEDSGSLEVISFNPSAPTNEDQFLELLDNAIKIKPLGALDGIQVIFNSMCGFYNDSFEYEFAFRRGSGSTDTIEKI